MPFPSPPWLMRAEAWLSLFAVRESGGDDRPSGLYGACFVDYGEGSVLTYHELLVARLVREGRSPQVRITDISSSCSSVRSSARPCSSCG